MTKRKRSNRQQQALAAQKARERKQRLQIGAIVTVVLAVLSVLLWAANRPRLVDGSQPAAPEGLAWGPVNAPVVIENWSDFNCSYCGLLATGVAKQIEEMYGETGRVRFEFKNFAFLQPNSLTAAEAAFCAAEQELFWPYHDMLFANQGRFADSELKQYSRELGLDQAAFDECLDSGAYSSEIERLREEGTARGVNSTPTLFVNDTKITGAVSLETFQQAIEDELAKAGQ